MSATNWRIPGNFSDWMRNMEKRMSAIERRPVVTTSKDIMGPSLGPAAVHLEDMDSEEASRNGMWHLHAGATNSPDPVYGWMGLTLAESPGWGVQVAFRVHNADGTLATGTTGQIRRFLIPQGEVGRIYGPWGAL